MQFQHIYKSIDAQTSIFYTWFEAMHTRIDLALCHLAESDSCTLAQEIFSEIKRIELFSNRFLPDSELSRINQEASTKPLDISPELYTIISDCIRHNSRTAGAFDITVQSKNNYRNGIRDIILDSTNRTTIFLKNENVQLDLCGYVKGYALDQIKALLLSHHCDNALINLGNSSVLALGNHPSGNGWKVLLPTQQGESITLHDECLTSSGNTAGHLHLIHPETGRCTDSCNIVSVVTPQGSIGEVLSTALCVCNDTQRQFIEKEFENECRVYSS